MGVVYPNAAMSGSYRSRELEQLRQELRRELRMFDDVSSHVAPPFLFFLLAISKGPTYWINGVHALTPDVLTS